MAATLLDIAVVDLLLAAGGCLGLLLRPWFGLELLIAGSVAGWLLQAVAPEAARRLREKLMGKPDE